MPTLQCPIKGFEDVSVTHPDEWLMGHIDQFNVGWNEAPEGSASSTKELFGTIALCDKIEGLDLEDIRNLPLRYKAVFNWLVRVIYVGGYLKAIAVPNAFTSPQPNTQRGRENQQKI